MSKAKTIATSLGVLGVSAALAACGSDSGEKDSSAGKAKAGAALPQGSEKVKTDPADFTTEIDNPYWPMKPGSRWVYQELHPGEPTERVVVTVTDKTKRIANGVTARVVRDEVSKASGPDKGKPTEVTDDWYAQDKDGNIWYMGEATTEYKNGKPVTTAGSFEAGKDGAQPGVVVPAEPKTGLSYRQEYYKGEAEDEAVVVSTDEQAEPPAGHYKGVLMTKDINPLEPKVLEFKFYAKGVGPVSTVGVSGGSKIEELVSYKEGS